MFFFKETVRCVCQDLLVEMGDPCERLRQSLSDAFRTSTHALWDLLFSMLRYRTYLSQNSKVADIDVAKKKKKMRQDTQKPLSRKAKDKHEGTMSC